MLTLSDIKAHLRLEGTAEDDLLAIYSGAADEYVTTVTGQDWATATTIPFSIKAAALLIVADLYENREAQTEIALKPNATVDNLLWPYRVF